jgi:hypothetical protein
MPKARSIVIAVGVTALVNVIVNVAARSGFPARLGATAAESRIPLPGDELFPNAQCQYDRARTVAARPSTVWPWIAQLGQNKAGFYSFELVENLFGCRIHGDDRIHPEWQSVAPGDAFALHPQMGLRVAEVTPELQLVLTSEGGKAPEGPEFHASWAFVLSPIALASGGTGTRVHLRERYQAPTATGLVMIKALSVVSALMSWRMLSRLAALATPRRVAEHHIAAA